MCPPRSKGTPRYRFLHNPPRVIVKAVVPDQSVLKASCKGSGVRQAFHPSFLSEIKMSVSRRRGAADQGSRQGWGQGQPGLWELSSPATSCKHERAAGSLLTIHAVT